MIQNLRNRMEKIHETFNKDLKELKSKQTVINNTITEIKNTLEGFPGGTVVKNPPANAGDMGSSPGLGRSHMPRSNKARAPQLLSLRSRAREPQLPKPTHLEPELRNKRSHLNEKPVHLKKE